MHHQFETLAIHGGRAPDKQTHACADPVYRTAAYLFDDTAHAARLFNLEEAGNIYTRLGNPTLSLLENRLSLLEGGAGALTTASGTAAIFYTIINLARQGDEIVSAGNLYGGTFTMFDTILPDMGISVRLTPVNDFAAVRAAITPRTRAIYVEAIGNPSLDVADLDAYAEIAAAHHLPLVVDATFVTPWLLRPLEHGATIVIHSLTKWLGGHGTVLGGAVVDSGTFDWNDPKFTLYTEPDPSYHGLAWGTLQGLPPFITRMRTVPLRNLGACLAPDNAWLFLQGLETLPLRMERHCTNAMKVASMLAEHPKVAWVRYPGLASDPSHAIATRLLHGGFGGMVVFGLKGGKVAGQQFIDGLQLFSHLANVGDAKSLALHPGSTTHSQLSDEQQRAAGLSPEMVRLSIGIEHPDDILADVREALGKVVG